MSLLSFLLYFTSLSYSLSHRATHDTLSLFGGQKVRHKKPVCSWIRNLITYTQCDREIVSLNPAQYVITIYWQITIGSLSLLWNKLQIAMLNLTVSDLLLEMFQSITIQVLCECVCAHSIVCVGVAAQYKPIFHLKLTPKTKLIPFHIYLSSAKLRPQSNIQRHWRWGIHHWE